ncbi:hypothetical protein [Streptomyces sp. NPDC000229]|uniref:hypothetical protein n=1 Tax=Streptomyces sp. NPDC000229 TaxID=3154247 RepID=UPI00331DE4BF
MRDGGSEGVGARSWTGGFRRPGRRRLLVSGIAAGVVLAAALVIPLTRSDAQPPCRPLPASTRALADDPAAATRALDPGDDLARLGSVRKLLVHERLCGDGARVLGRVVEAATRSSGPGKPHTMAQARAAYAVAASLDGIDLPAGLAPGVARMVAEYIADAARDDSVYHDDASGPAVPPEQSLPDQEGHVWLGRFLAPREAHAAFEYTEAAADAHADVKDLVAELAKDPEAFAVLYDAERAYFAHYLERLTARGGDPAARRASREEPDAAATNRTDIDLRRLVERVGDLMKYRARYALDGTIPDLAAFDRSVREHTRGTFRPAPRQLDTRPPMGDIADRPVTGPVRGDLTDGRRQLFTVLDRWAEERGVPARRARAMRQLVDDAYVRALWMRA